MVRAETPPDGRRLESSGATAIPPGGDRDRERLRVVGIGGTLRPGSSTERALDTALGAAHGAGAQVARFTGKHLAELPLYSPATADRNEASRGLIESVRGADGLIIASPGYHACISGLVKNALDYLEDLRDDERPYLSGRAVGCLVTGAGWQATVSTLTALRSVVHALRGWPTPLGATINTRDVDPGEDGKARFQLSTVGSEVVEFARLQRTGAGSHAAE